MTADSHTRTNKRTLWKILSILLDYPEPSLLDALPDLHAVLDEVPDCGAKAACREFIAYLAGNPLHLLQEEYTRVFDLHPPACLNVSCHSHADGHERGWELARFTQAYQRAGFDPVAGELPDFLPMVLEFMYVSPEATAAGMLKGIQPAVRSLALNLLEVHSPYAALVKAIADWREECSMEGDA